MVMTDPIADLLITIKNCVLIRKRVARVYYSKLKARILYILHREGYILSFDIKNVKEKHKQSKYIFIYLKYIDDKSVIHNVKRISKPGLRIYKKYNELHNVVYNGLGIVIVSTSRGLMTDRQSYRRKIGGEVLAYVW